MPKLMQLPFKVEHTARNVTTVRLDFGSQRREAWFLLSSDRHHDNPATDQAMEKRHLEQARDRGAGIIDAGDLFCAMQGKYDKRSDKNSLRPEHQRGDYLDALVSTAAGFYQPFAKQIVVLGVGNHETAVRSRQETDLTERLAERLSASAGCKVAAGGYGGWVRFLFRIHTRCSSRVLHYYHGTGGGGPVTRGVIQTNRLAVFNPDADFVLSGHTHDSWIVPIARQRINDAGRLYHDEQVHVRTPGYKNAWADGHAGFEVERMHGPKPKGAAWLRFYVDGGEIRSEVSRAQ
jgi:hypothetical protein